MKVVHFITSIDRTLGGVSTYMQLLTKELGKVVDLVIVTRPTSSPLELENCRILYLPFPLSEIRDFRKQWISILRKEKPEIVHINGIWMIQTWIIQREALKLGIKTFITPHGMLEPWIMNRHPLKKKLALLLYQKKALKSALALISTAESEKSNILNLKINSNVVNIPNGVDISTIQLKKNWNKRRRILYISRIHIKKGIELLLDAISTLKNELNGYEITIAGEGDISYINDLKERAKEIDNVYINFIGGVYGNDKWTLYQESDFFVLPTYSENFGYVIAEALASGTPVITTKNAPWEDIESCKCGFWINRDLQSLCNSIREMIVLESNDLQKMGKSGRELIEKKYSTKSVVDSLLSIYKNK